MCPTPTKCRLSLSARHAKPTPRAPCRGRRRPRNTVKNDVFEHFSNIQRKIHINLSGGFGRGSGGGIPAVQQKGRRQGRRAYITFGYQPKASGKDTGPWPAPGFKRLTPDSRAPAKQGEGLCLAGSLGGKEKSKKVVADDVSTNCVTYLQHRPKIANIPPTNALHTFQDGST